MKIGIGRKTMMGTVVTLLIAGIAWRWLTAGGIVAWEYTTQRFCANVCHAVHPEEPVAHAASSHARVQCVECHMGRLSTLQLMAAEAHTRARAVGNDRRLRTADGVRRPCGRRATRARPVTGRRSDHSDSVRTKVRYDADAKSRETRTTLLMHTGFGEVRESGSKGIHWHIAQEVTYAAVDPQKQKIPWVQARGADGKMVTYFDPTAA